MFKWCLKSFACTSNVFIHAYLITINKNTWGAKKYKANQKQHYKQARNDKKLTIQKVSKD